MPKTKVCTKCHQRKKLSAFPKDNRRKDKVQGICKSCVNKRNRVKQEAGD